MQPLHKTALRLAAGLSAGFASFLIEARLMPNN